MELIKGNRDSGKTYKLICEAYKNKKPIIVKTRANKNCILENSRKFNKIVEVYTIYELRGKNIEEAYIDDIDEILDELLATYFGSSKITITKSTITL